VSADPFAVLGVERGASAAEVSAAYRRLAKRWHPDRGGGARAAGRMAEINAAYDLLRSERWLEQRSTAPVVPPLRRAARRTAAGAWLPEAVRRALGRELLGALTDGEDVALVTPTATWASPQALLAVTGSRLLWLLDDAPTHRIRALRFRDIDGFEHRLRRPLRRSAVLYVRTTGGRRLSFAELRPATAAAIARHLRAAVV
jgi:DnaJ domain